MGLKAQNAAAWQGMLLQLLPQGAAWSKHLDSTLSKLAHAFAKQFTSVDKSCDVLAFEIIPNQAVQLLEAYEAYLGLPECLQSEQSISQRQASIKLKDTQTFGFTSWQIEAQAAALGFDVKVEEVFPHHCLRACTAAIYSSDKHRHVIRIHVLNINKARMSCLDNIKTSLLSFDARRLECHLNKYKMAGKYYEYIYD
jgi:uncharacterized protein YmfQ (DUF2313 family)